METAEGGWFKVFGVVTNRDIDPEELVWWSRQRCGKGEEVHSALKEDLAGGRLPSGQFGSNAAWWAITALSFNHELGYEAVGPRRRVGEQADEGGTLRGHIPTGPGGPPTLIINLSWGHPSYSLLCQARRRILALAHGPPLT